MNAHLHLPRLLRKCAIVAALASTLLVLGTSRAPAALFPAQVIDGPNSSILDVVGATMAPDGTGGLLYRKVLGGEAHLFVSRFIGGAWQPPIQVDTGQLFAASFPAIAAGKGGRLLVVWAEPYATVGQTTRYELMSAELQPGSSGFDQAIQVDPKDIGNATAVFPSLSMAPNGEAYVAYRVIGDTQTLVALRPGDEQLDVRVAHFNGLTWSSLGAVNRSPFVAMRHPDAANAPVIAINGVGTGAVVAWQEPDVSGAARIWARRIFGTTLGNLLPVSQETANGQPITTDAEAPAIAASMFGEARVAYRLSGGAGSPFGTPRMFVNTLPSGVGVHASQFTGAVVVDSAHTLGPPSVSIDDHGDFRLAYTADGAARMLTGAQSAFGLPTALGAVATDPALTAIDPMGGGVTAWPATAASGPGPQLPVVDVRENLADGAWQQAQLSAPLSGPVAGLSLGGSTRGDALLAFAQGPPGQVQVMGAVAQAPPSSFLLTTPPSWVKRGAAQVSWEPAPDALVEPTYSLIVDGQVKLRHLTALAARLDPRGLGDGVYQVQVLATDSSGQQTTSGVADLKVDAAPPQVMVRATGSGRVLVRVFDRASGVRTGSVSIRFGDGGRARRRARVHHLYAHPGSYVITVLSEDNVGNRGLVHVRVRVR